MISDDMDNYAYQVWVAADRYRRLQKAIEVFEFEDGQDGTAFDCAFLDAIIKLKKEFT